MWRSIASRLFIVVLLVLIFLPQISTAGRTMRGEIPLDLVFVNPNHEDRDKIARQLFHAVEWWRRNLPGSQISYGATYAIVQASDPFSIDVCNNKQREAWVHEVLAGRPTGRIEIILVDTWDDDRGLRCKGTEDGVLDYSPGPYAILTTYDARSDEGFAYLAAHALGHVYGASHRGGGIMDPEYYDQGYINNILSDLTVREVGGVR
jgi:hypothetical protein